MDSSPCPFMRRPESGALKATLAKGRQFIVHGSWFSVEHRNLRSQTRNQQPATRDFGPDPEADHRVAGDFCSHAKGLGQPGLFGCTTPGPAIGARAGP
jgi:hypothetical protein